MWIVLLQIFFYCDLYGYSRKYNVFMYGNNISEVEVEDGIGVVQVYFRERFFFWFMFQRVCIDCLYFIEIYNGQFIMKFCIIYKYGIIYIL